MNKKQTKDSLPMWVILVILLIAMVAVYFFFKNENVNRYKNDLSQRIREKEETVNFLNCELSKLKNLHDTLKSEAIKLYKFIKAMAIILLLVIGIVCYAVLEMEFWSALFLIVSVISFVYYSITIIVQNKIGDFNRTLALIQDYIIQQRFIKADFNPRMIEVVEKRLHKEQTELFEIKEQYLLLTVNNNQDVKIC